MSITAELITMITVRMRTMRTGVGSPNIANRHHKSHNTSDGNKISPHAASNGQSIHVCSSMSSYCGYLRVLLAACLLLRSGSSAFFQFQEKRSARGPPAIRPLDGERRVQVDWRLCGGRPTLLDIILFHREARCLYSCQTRALFSVRHEMGSK
jgi:hypothetical protein